MLNETNYLNCFRFFFFRMLEHVDDIPNSDTGAIQVTGTDAVEKKKSTCCVR